MRKKVRKSIKERARKNKAEFMEAIGLKNKSLKKSIVFVATKNKKSILEKISY